MTSIVDREGAGYAPRKIKGVERHVPLFVRALAGLLEGGVVLDKAVALAGESIGDERFRPVSDGLALAIRQGDSLSGALSKADRVWGLLFGPTLIALVRSGEAGGNLSEVLLQQAAAMDRMGKMRRDLSAALIYPALLAGVTFISLLVIIGVVLPRLEGLFLGLSGEVPWSARLLMGFGQVMAVAGPLLLLLLIAVGLLVSALRRDDARCIEQDRFLLGLPAIGALIRQLEAQRFCRAFSALIKGGVVIPEALGLAAETCRNGAIRAGLLSCREGVSAGQGLGETMARHSDCFPPVLVQFARLGMESEQLAHLFDHYADMAEDDLDIRVKRLIAVLEPGLVLAIGLVMAMIILALFQTILGLNQALI